MQNFNRIFLWFVIPSSGMMPLSLSVWSCISPIKLQAEIVKNITIGIPSSWAVVMVNGMKPSEIMQVTGGMFEVALLSFEMRSEKGAKKFCKRETQREVMSWVMLRSNGGRLSGMVLNQKLDKPSKELGPLDFRKCWWLNSVLTKVMWKPLCWRSFANFSIAFLWLWIGYGIQTAWGLSATDFSESISSFLLLVCVCAFALWLYLIMWPSCSILLWLNVQIRIAWEEESLS